MHSCFRIYILFTDVNEGEEDQQHVFLSCVSFTFLGRGTDSGSHIDLQGVQDMHIK